MSLADVLPALLGLAWLLPLASFVLILFCGPRMGRAGVMAGSVATAAILGSFVLSLLAFGLWLGWSGLPLEPHHDHAADHDEHAAAPLEAVPGPWRLTAFRAADAPAKADVHAAHADDAPAAGHDAGHAAHDEHAAAAPAVYTGTWYTLARFGRLELTVSYYIDALTVAMFVMVTLIATCIHFYATGYMHDELSDVTDHEVRLADGRHLHRPGRFHRFFQYLSLFCFSMLGLVVAGNIAQVFVFWELVGVCSYFLIGFYVERHSASTAANKAFIVNRVGDFGMIVGLMALWASLGTFAFGDIDGQPGIFSQLRTAENQHQLAVPDGMVLEAARDRVAAVVLDHEGITDAARSQIESVVDDWRSGTTLTDNAAGEPTTDTTRYGYALLVIAGLGIFCGCVGKSAQFPLHVWLPDAMEGPTPVSALVHSATMVAAGVYLVGRFYPVFTPEALLVIAYCGAITLFLAATIAIVANDIKRVLAYSTVSQLGYMMLALGVGGWIAGLFHLITHAFFKSLLFMCSGSVIHACHTNDMQRMGGLRHKMPWTAYTMLVGCLAIIGAGVPFLLGFSGYYSKDAIVAQALSFWQQNPTHGAVFFLAAAGGASMTAFYMFRLWFLTFAGQPRDAAVHAHVHESPKVMYLPLVVLASFAVGVAWTPVEWLVVGLLATAGVGAVIWRLQSAAADAGHPAAHGEHASADSASHAGHNAHAHHGHEDHGHAHGHHDAHHAGHEAHHAAEPPQVALRPVLGLCVLAVVLALAALAVRPHLTLVNLLEQARPLGIPTAPGDVARGVLWPNVVYPGEHASHAPATHVIATLVAFSTALAGFLLAVVFYGVRWLDAADVRRQFAPVYTFLWNKWYFDELYQFLFVAPAHFIGALVARFDKQALDGLIDGSAVAVERLARVDDRLDRTLVDGLVNLLAEWTYSLGRSLRAVQTGRLRQYVMLIVVGTVALTMLIHWAVASGGP